MFKWSETPIAEARNYLLMEGGWDLLDKAMEPQVLFLGREERR
jgi:hypothetical protein